MRTSNTVTPKTTSVARQGSERMLEPGLTDLFETFVIRCSTAHSIKILWNHRVIGIWHREPIQIYISVVAGGGSNSQANPGSAASKLRHGRNLSDDHVGPIYKSLCARRHIGFRGQPIRLKGAFDQFRYLNRMHGRLDPEFE